MLRATPRILGDIGSRGWARRLVLLAASMGCCVSLAHAQPPQIEEISPLGAQRGAVVQLNIAGEHLDTVSGLLFADPGVEVVDFRATEEDEAVATLRVSEDCPLGEHVFWTIGKGGASEPRVIQVGPHRVLEESEPNDSLADAPRIDPNGATHAGVVEGADVDTYRFDLKRGERLSAEVVAMRLGGAFLDAHLEALGPGGEVLAAVDDTTLLKQDPHLSIVAQQDGPHYLRVRDSAFDGEYLASYLLHAGRSCQPVIAYPCGGRPGEALKTRLVGDASGAVVATVNLPTGEAGFYEYRHDDGQGGPSLLSLPLRVSDLRNVTESDEQSTNAGEPPFALNGVISKPREIDRFGFDMNAGQRFRVEVFGKRVGSPIDSVIEVVGPDGKVVARNDDSAVHDSAVLLTAQKSGFHTLRVWDHLGHGGAEFVYRVELDHPKPELHLAATPLRTMTPQPAQAITLAPGGRYALLLSATRSGFFGPVAVRATGLPTGVRATAEPISPGSHLCQVVFEAADTATPSAGMIGFTGDAYTDDTPVFGGLNQKIGLVRGQPRQTVYYSVELDRLPLVITQSAPFSIHVEEPRARLSQDGLMELNVTATRSDEFQGPITLNALQMPSWIEASEDEVRIEAGESSGRFPLIAGDRAEPGVYPMVLVASGRVDGAEIQSSSLRFEVRVDDPYAKVELHRGSAQQNGVAEINCQVHWLRPPEGPVTARLLGLPKQTEAPVVEVSPTGSEVVFPVRVGAGAPVALHNTLYVELNIPEAGENRREYHARGGVLEVLREGAQPQDPRSRLDILRSASRQTSY